MALMSPKATQKELAEGSRHEGLGRQREGQLHSLSKSRIRGPFLGLL